MSQPRPLLLLKNFLTRAALKNKMYLLLDSLVNGPLNLRTEPALGCWPPCSQGPLSSSLKRGRRREDPGSKVVRYSEDHKPGARFSIGDAGSLWERNIVLKEANTRENKERKRLIDAILTRVRFSFWE